VPSAIAFSMSLLVAASSRTLTFTVSVPPRRSNSRSCSTRSNFDLRAEVDVADLIEEERSTLGHLEAAFLPGVGAGERALLVAEQLRLDERIGQRRAAHFHEWLLRPQRVVVNGVRDEFLAGARLAANQHGGVGLRDLGHLLVHLPRRTAGPNDVREVVALAQLLPQVRILVGEPPPLLVDHPLHVERLRDHAADDADELDAAVVVALRLEPQVDGERADRLAVEHDRNADEAQLLLGVLGAPRRKVEERRFALTRGTTIGLLLSTTLPVMPSPSLMRMVRARSSKPSTASTCSSPSRSNVIIPRTNAVMTKQRAKHTLQSGLQIECAREGLADLEQR
jgi:hypothetical protein